MGFSVLVIWRRPLLIIAVMTRSETPASLRTMSASASVVYLPGWVLMVWMMRSSPRPALVIFMTELLSIAGAVVVAVSGPSTDCGESEVCWACWAWVATGMSERQRANRAGRISLILRGIEVFARRRRQ